MSIWKRRIVFVFLFFTMCFCVYGFYNIRKTLSREIISTSISDVSSTKEWQDMLSRYLVMRNNLINDILDGKYSDHRKINTVVKAFEYSPLLDGDMKTFEYMYQHPHEFSSRNNSVKVEYSGIRKLTKNEVTMAAKVCYDENTDMMKKYDYEVTFTNIDGKWKISRFSYLN